MTTTHQVPTWARLAVGVALTVAGATVGVGIAWGSLEARVAASERRLDRLETLIADVHDQQVRIGENVARICEATGARCR